jgi:hypothetical protein
LSGVTATPNPVARLANSSMVCLVLPGQPVMKVGQTWNCSLSSTMKAR